jgi:hypothetical protein
MFEALTALDAEDEALGSPQRAQQRNGERYVVATLQKLLDDLLLPEEMAKCSAETKTVMVKVLHQGVEKILQSWEPT